MEEKTITKSKAEAIEHAAELSIMFNNIIDSTIELKPVINDPGGYLNSKPILNEFLIRFAYLNATGVLVLNEEITIDINDFLDIADVLIDLKEFSDSIDDWDDDAYTVLGRLNVPPLEAKLLDQIAEDVVKVFPISAFLYTDEGIIYETDLVSLNPNVFTESDIEHQNMAIEDQDEYQDEGRWYC